MPQLLSSNSERIAPTADVVDGHKPVGTDVDFPDVLADLKVDVDELPDDVVEYGRARVGETEESRTRLLAELEDMIYGEHAPGFYLYRRFIRKRFENQRLIIFTSFVKRSSHAVVSVLQTYNMANYPSLRNL